jgi:hypothetical protein
MENTNIAPLSGNLRKTLVRLLGTAAPIMAMAMPGAAMAQTAVNTARVAAPAGAFEINAANNESTDTDTVLAVIVATNDSATGINGLAGATAVVNAFTADTVNGVAASPSNATLSVAPGAVPAGLVFDTATGNVNVAAGTPAGTYSFTYTICETLNPTNCQTATISVTVVAAPIAADPDTVSGVNGANGAPNVLDVIAGDTLNGTQVTLAQVNLTVTTPATPASPGAPVPSLNVATGQVSVPAGTPAGTYTITYQICEQLNPTNCATNTATVVVAASPIVATNDSASGINGLAGGTAVVNAFTSDTINGVAASPSNAVLSVASGSSVPAGLTFNTSTGNVDVAPGTPAGTYSFDYHHLRSTQPDQLPDRDHHGHRGRRRHRRRSGQRIGRQRRDRCAQRPRRARRRYPQRQPGHAGPGQPHGDHARHPGKPGCAGPDPQPGHRPGLGPGRNPCRHLHDHLPDLRTAQPDQLCNQHRYGHGRCIADRRDRRQCLGHQRPGWRDRCGQRVHL